MSDQQVRLVHGAPDMQEEPVEPRLDADQVLEICNRVRHAGGGEILEVLLPGVAIVESECLIARNLNFDCEVSPHIVVDNDTRDSWVYRYTDGEVAWFMDVDDPDVLDTIAEAMEWPVVSVKLLPNRGPEASRLLLPRELGRTATAFDRHELPAHLYTNGGDER